MSEAAHVVARTDPQYVEATDIENGTFMDPEKGTLNRTAAGVNNQEGFVVYEMKYNSSDTGVNGRGTLLTITFKVKENAPTGSFEFSVYESRIILTDGMSQQVMTTPSTMTIKERNTQTSTTAQTTTTQQSGNSLGSAGAIVVVVGILSLFVGMLLVVRKL